MIDPALLEAINSGGYIAGLVFMGVWLTEIRRRLKRIEDVAELKKVCRYAPPSNNTEADIISSQ